MNRKSFFTRWLTLFAFALPLAVTVGTASAQKPAAKLDEPSLKVFDVWAKTTVPGGSVSAAYMHIKSAKPLKLVKVASPAANIVEIHDMKMKDGVMEMKAIDALDIPAGKLVDLKPGGLHIMLIKVVKPINKGDKVPLTLTFETPDKKTFTREVMAAGQEKDGHAHRH
jgi:periplasmic copper chaperone A